MRPLIVVLIVALGGCGTSDEERIRATIAADHRAQEREDWKGVCGLRTPAGRRELIQASPRPRANTCAEAWTFASEDNEPIVTFEFESPARELTDIDVDGDAARARYDDGSVQRFRKLDGRWLIDAEHFRRARRRPPGEGASV